jgi:hypothetical protein
VLTLLAGRFVFATLHLWVTALTQTVAGLQWLALAFKESRQTAADLSAGHGGYHIGMIAITPYATRPAT